MHTLTLLQQPHFHLGSHVTQVFCCCFSPDGSTILSGSRDNTLKLWRTRDGSLINTLNDVPTTPPREDLINMIDEVTGHCHSRSTLIQALTACGNDTNSAVLYLLDAKHVPSLGSRVPVPLDFPGATSFVEF